jgi:hypothetical protein
LVIDNLATYKASALYEAYLPEEAKQIWDRFEFACTPKYGSWLNMAEIELNALMGQCLKRRIDKLENMEKEVATWQTHRNNKTAKVYKCGCPH